MSAPALAGPLLLPEHHGPRHVLPRKQPREEQAWEVGCSERRAREPQHQPVHRPDAPGGAGRLRLLPGAAHLPREALPHHQWLPQPHVSPLRLRPPPTPCRESPDGQPCVLISMLGGFALIVLVNGDACLGVMASSRCRGSSLCT